MARVITPRTTAYSAIVWAFSLWIVIRFDIFDFLSLLLGAPS
jgi:hypothetical protein